jgi:hypothetical protein
MTAQDHYRVALTRLEIAEGQVTVEERQVSLLTAIAHTLLAIFLEMPALDA